MCRVFFVVILFFYSLIYAAGEYLYLTGVTPDFLTGVYVVNVSTNELVTLISTEGSFTYCVPNQVGDRLYVSNQGSGNYGIAVINTITNTLDSVISSNLIGEPAGLAVSPDGNYLYVARADGAAIVVVDTATEEIVTTISTASASSTIQGIAISPDGATIYACLYNQNKIGVISTAANTLTGTISLASATGPLSVVFNSTGTKAYVAGEGGADVTLNNFSVIDVAAGTSTAVLVNQHLYDLIITPDDAYVYTTVPLNILTFSPTAVLVINTATNAIEQTLTDVGFTALAVGVTVDGSTVYIGSSIPTFTMINTSTYDTTSLNLTGVLANAKMAIFSIPSPTTTMWGEQVRNIFLTGIDSINSVAWLSPQYLSFTPEQYAIYRDQGLTKLAAVVPGDCFLFEDHNREENVSYSYYLAAIDGDGTQTLVGNVTIP